MSSGTIINPEIAGEAPQGSGTIINTEAAGGASVQGGGTVINVEAAGGITPQGSGTVINVEAAGGAPVRNSGTMLNTEEAEVVSASSRGTGTVINTAAMMKTELAPGQPFRGESGATYVIIEKINKESGEATLFKARGQENETEYVIKVYDKVTNRIDATKREVIETLKAIDCPYLPKLYETGRVNGYPYEVMEFYSGGSLTHEKMTLEEIKERFLPAMNEALHVLDEHNIVHKDIKPDNIMRRGDSYVLMDFGISSVRSGSNSVVFTQTGWSPEYAPPEANSGNASIKWDYYSLGITMYELFFGHRPYANMSQEERAVMASEAEDTEEDLYPVLKNAVCPEEFKILLRGLTRNKRKRRWAYEQVSSWLAGKTVLEPSAKSESGKMMEYTFENTPYYDLDSLAQALGEKWNKGKGHLFRGYLGDHLQKAGMYDLANLCADIAETDDDQDKLFANWLYTISTNQERLYWKGSVWSPLELGMEILGKLWECMDVYNRENGKLFQNYIDFLNSDALILFYEAQEELSDEHAALSAKIREMVMRIRGMSYCGDAFYRSMYALAYALTRTPVLSIGGKQFSGHAAFMEYMESLFADAEKEEELQTFLNKLGMKKGTQWEKNNLELQFGCWLEAVKEYSR